MSVLSMTGFGEASGTLSDRLALRVQASSLNSRGLEVVIRSNLSPEPMRLVHKLRRMVRERFMRGRVTVQLKFQWIGETETSPVINQQAIASLERQLKELRIGDGPLVPEVALGQLLALPGVVSGPEEPELQEDEEASAENLVSAALDLLAEERSREGRALEEQLVKELEVVRSFAAWLSENRRRLVEKGQEALKKRISQALQGQIEEWRIAQEAAILADRMEIAEELTRIDAHISRFDALLKAPPAPKGRSLDFVCQELIRELNTVGSKLRNVEVVEGLIDAKSAVERMREQLANVE